MWILLTGLMIQQQRNKMDGIGELKNLNILEVCMLILKTMSKLVQDIKDRISGSLFKKKIVSKVRTKSRRDIV